MILRIALLSMTEFAADAPQLPIAGLALGKRNIGRCQADLALSLGCERIICLAPGLTGDLKSLQQHVEKAGMKFHVVGAARGLFALIRETDDIVVMTDGILPLNAEVEAFLSGQPCILSFNADGAVEAGFERIDLNHAWAGAMVIKGELVDRLAQLPADFNPISALLRIALQAQLPLVNLPGSWLDEEHWVAVSTVAQLQEMQPRWIARHAPTASFWMPGKALGAWLARKFAPKILRQSKIATGALIGGGMLAFAGAGLAWIDYGVLGFCLVGAGWLCGVAGQIARNMVFELQNEYSNSRKIEFFSLYPWVFDAALLASGVALLPGGWLDRLYVSLMLIGGLRVASYSLTANWARLLQDRLVLAIVLAVSVLAGYLMAVMQLGGLILLCLVLAGKIAGSRLTRA